MIDPRLQPRSKHKTRTLVSRTRILLLCGYIHRNKVCTLQSTLLFFHRGYQKRLYLRRLTRQALQVQTKSSATLSQSTLPTTPPPPPNRTVTTAHPPVDPVTYTAASTVLAMNIKHPTGVACVDARRGGRHQAAICRPAAPLCSCTGLQLIRRLGSVGCLLSTRLQT